MKSEKSDFKLLLRDIFTSGLYDSADYETTRKVVLINVIYTFAIAFLLIYGIDALIVGNKLVGVFDLSVFALLIAEVFHLRKTKNLDFAAGFSVVVMTVLAFFLFITGGVGNTGFMWSYAYPMLVLYLMGAAKGIRVILGFLSLLAVLTIFSSFINIMHIYSYSVIIRFFGSFILVTAFTYFYERVRENVHRSFLETNSRLEKNVEELKKNKVELTRNERFLTDVFNAIQDGICVLDSNFNVLKVNPWVEKMYPGEAPLEHKKCHKVFQRRDEPCLFCPALKSIETGKSHREIVPYQAAGRQDGWIELTSYPLFDRDGKLVKVIEYIKDISELKRKELELNRHRANLVSVVDNTTDFIWSVDRDYRLKMANLPLKQIAQIIFNFDLKEGMDTLKPMPEKERSLWKDRYDKALAGSRFSFEYSFDFGKEPMFTEINLNPIRSDDGTIMGASCYAWDITERKIAERQLRESEQRYRYIFENTAVSLWEEDFSKVYERIENWKKDGITDFKKFFSENPEKVDELSSSLVINNINNATLKLYKAHSKEEFLGSFESIFNNINKDIFRDEFTALAEGKTHFETEMEAVTFDGRHITVLLKINFPEGKENAHRLMVNILDITERKQAERYLRFSEQKYRSLFESSADGIGVLRDNRFYECNNVAAKLLGVKKEELIGRAPLDFSPLRQPNGRMSSEIIEERLYEVSLGHTQSFEWVVKQKNGNLLTLDLNLSKIEELEGEYYLLLGRDITSKKATEKELAKYRNNLEEIVITRTEELSRANAQLYREIEKHKGTELALKESEEHFKDLVEKAGIAIVMDDENGCLKYCNDQLKNIFGYSSHDDILGMNILELVHPEDKDYVKKAHTGRMTDIFAPSQYEFRGVKKNGEIFYCEVKTVQMRKNDKIIGSRSYLWDITERKETAMKHRLSDRILQNAGTIVIVFDVNAKVIYTTPYVEIILGYEKNEFLDDGWWHISHPEENERLRAINHIKALASGEEKLSEKTYETLVYTKSGERRWLQWQNSIGEKNTVISVGSNITERKIAENLIRRAKESAEQANKLKSQFLANVSHEIRTPLNGIIGFTEIILAADNINQIYGQARSIIRESESLLSLINQLLDHAKIEAGKLELEYRPMDINKLIEDVISIANVSARDKGLDFRVFVDENVPPYIMADFLRLRQILMNLLSNALKFTDDGYIALNVGVVDTYKDKAKLIFTVEDTGIGIPKEKQKTIFQSFIQADGSTTRKYGGTGLGTNISKQLVELMGGNIGVESQPGKGSEFWFSVTFSLSDPPLEEAEDMQITDEISLALAEERKQNSTDILVVEDYKPNQEVAGMHLRAAGHNVFFADNGREAVEKCSERTFDLILMDIQMPELDGFEAARLIRQDSLCKDVIILALTANADDETKMQCTSAGMNDIVTKPIRRRTFLATVDKWLFLSGSEDNEEIFELDPETISDDLPYKTGTGQKTQPAEEETNQDAEKALPINFETALDEFGSKEVVRKVLEQFMSNVGEQVEKIRKSFQDNDVEALRREAHSVKGGAATLEAVPLSSAATDLEFMAKENRMDEFDALFTRFLEEYSKLKEFIEKNEL